MSDADAYRRIGILGGTFDPIHNGHLAAATAVRYECELDSVFLIPAKNPPHKTGAEITDASHRLKMAELAVKNVDYIKVLDIELKREGESYSVDTVTELCAMYPESRFLFIIGADMLLSLTKWKDIEKLLKMCRFVAVTRPGYDTASVKAEIEHIQQLFGERVRLVVMPGVDVSGTELRERLSLRAGADYLLPDNILDYIKENGLYDRLAGTESMLMEKYKEIYNDLRKRQRDKRFNHTLGVVSEAVRLSDRYCQNVEKAIQAALVHDCAKCYTVTELMETAALYGIELSDGYDNAELLHAPVGAALAEFRYGITDKDVLDAVRYHTIGRKNMSVLEKIILAADYIEPTRRHTQGIEKVRKIAYQDLDRCVELCLGMKKEFTRAKGQKVITHQ